MLLRINSTITPAIITHKNIYYPISIILNVPNEGEKKKDCVRLMKVITFFSFFLEKRLL